MNISFYLDYERFRGRDCCERKRNVKDKLDRNIKVDESVISFGIVLIVCGARCYMRSKLQCEQESTSMRTWHNLFPGNSRK